ncbi:MAG: tyrosine-type recombinase/integrase [Lachnospiraceae bacterium]|nr:tyrosine-type recombinase/integrase [Lachnospiraceae bacterium]
MNDITLKLLTNRHTCHETRHITASLLADNLVDPRIVKVIMGHSAKDDVTLGTYTHLDFSVLLNAIDTI